MILVPASKSALISARKLTESEFQYACFHCALIWKGMNVGLGEYKGLTEKKMLLEGLTPKPLIASLTQKIPVTTLGIPDIGVCRV